MTERFFKPGEPGIAETLRREGVVFIDQFFDAAHVERTRQALERYERDVLPTVPPAANERFNDGTLRCMHDLHKYDPWFLEMANGPIFLDLVRAAVPWEPVMFYLESFPKPPGAGGIPAHQELYTTPVDPPEFLHMWIALEDVTAANGGLAFYRRSHRLGLAPHSLTAPNSEGGRFYGVDPQVMEQLSRFRVEPDYPAGSAAIFDCRTIHLSGANTSGRPRPVLVVGFRGAHTTTLSEVDLVTSMVARYLRETLGLQQQPDDRTLAELGGDEAGALRLLERLRAEYDVELTVQEVSTQPPTVIGARIAAVLERRQTASR